MARKPIMLPDERDRHIPGMLSAPENAPVGDDDLDIVENADGSVGVSEPEEEVGESEFLENLAEILEESELDNIARDLMRRIEEDKESRRGRDEQYAMGLRRTGLSEDAPGGASFAGASRAAHPMLAEGAIDFSASAMRELLPPDGPVKTNIAGDQTQEKLAIAERQSKYLNWYMLNKMEEYPEELAQTTTQLPLGGSQYMKFWPDAIEKRAVCEFVPVDDVLLPYGCASFWSSPRITHVQRLPETEWEDRIESGMYREVVDTPSGEVPTPTKAAEVSERIEGTSTPTENLEGIRLVYEVNTFLKLSIDKEERLPYLISICERTNKVVALYRNWEEDDKKRNRLHWMADFAFIPWRGAYKLGLTQLIGGLSAAATGALRSLLDSALVNTIPILAKLKAAKFGGQDKNFNAMSAIEIEAGTTVDDIRKTLMPLPFNPPSPVLFSLLEWITNAAKGVVTTASEKIAEASNQMPMGTALALIEQDAKVFSSIHAGLHRSQKKCLKIIARILKDPEYCNVEEQIEEFGEVLCTPEDFARPLGVIPVSDPNIFSEGQRYAQMHLVDAQATKYPQLHNLYEVVRSSYKLAKIPDIDKILPPPKEPQEMNAVAENSSVMLGNPVMAFPEQNHLAHIETHMRFIMDPLFGSSPAAIPKSYPEMMEHIKQHLSFLYAKTMHDIASEALGRDLGDLIKDKKTWGNVDEVLAAASMTVHDRLTKLLAPLGPEISKMMIQIEKMRVPPPMDPSQAALRVAGMEDARAREDGERKAALEAERVRIEREKAEDAAANAARTTEIKAAEVAGKVGKLAADAMADARQGVLDENAQAHQQGMDIAGHALDVAGHEQGVVEHATGVDQQDREFGLKSVQHQAAENRAAQDRAQQDDHFQQEQERAAREADAQRAAAASKPPTGAKE